MTRQFVRNIFILLGLLSIHQSNQLLQEQLHNPLSPPSPISLISSGDDKVTGGDVPLSPQEDEGGSGGNEIILIAPPTPDIPKVYIVNLTQVLIKWDYPTTTPTSYIVQCRSNDFKDNNFHNVTAGLISSTHFYFSSTNLASYYIFRIIAYQGGVASSPSFGSQLFVNGQSAPSGLPVELSATHVTNTSLMLIWSTPKPAIDRSYSYHIYKGKSPDKLSEVDTLVGGDQQYTFRQLSPNTSYYFAVQADIAGIRSILSKTLNQATKPIGTIFPLSFTVTPLVTMATVTWTPPSITINDILEGFTVLYLPRELVNSVYDVSNFHQTMFPNNATSGGVVGLEEGVVYVFMMRYKIDNTQSPLSRPLVVQMETSVVCTGCIGVYPFSLLLKWKHSNHSNISTTYSITSPTCTNTTLTTPNSSISLSIPIGSPWTHCVYSISLVTQYYTYGRPVYCPPNLCTTPSDKPSGFPSNFTGAPLSSHSLLLSWTPLPSYLWNSPSLIHYIISCTDGGVAGGCGSRFLSASGNSSSFLVDDLLPFTTYKFVIAAENEKGFGPNSDSVHITTLEDVPTGPPSSLTVTLTSGSCVTLTWTPPTLGERNGIITKYIIYYTDNNNTLLVHSTVATNTSLSGLQYGTEYSVWIQAWTSLGGGPNSSELNFTTFYYTQPEIINFNATKSTPTNQQENQKCFIYLIKWSFNINITSFSPIIKLTQINLTYYTNTATGLLHNLTGISLYDNSTEINSDYLNPNTNYTLQLNAIFQLDNGSTVNTSKTFQLSTPDCPGVTTQVVAIVTGTVVIAFILCVLILVCTSLYWLRKKRSKHHSTISSTYHHTRHAVIGQALQPFPPSIPNDYINNNNNITLNGRRDERGDGQSSHSNDSEGEEGSSFIHRHDLSSSSDTISTQNDESSNYDEDAPLINNELLINTHPLRDVSSLHPTGEPLYNPSYVPRYQHRPFTTTDDGGYVHVMEDFVSSPQHYSYHIPRDVMTHTGGGGGGSDDGRLGPDGRTSSLSFDSLPDSISSAPADVL